MHFSCSQSQLSTNLSLVSRAVASRPTHPVLANILLTTDIDSNTLCLTAFDLNLGIQVRFPVEVRKSGSMTLPAKLLNDIISRLPDDEVSLEIDEETNTATILCGSGKYQVRGLPAAEFPELPEISDGQSSYLPVEAVLAGLNGSLFAASTDESKRVLTGVHVKVNEEGLEFAATDGHRLSVVQMPYAEEETPLPPQAVASLEVTIPSRALKELDRMLHQHTEGMIAVQFDQSQMVFQSVQPFGNNETRIQTMTSRLLDGAYPDYRRLIPVQFAHQVSLERKPFTAAVERVAVLADQKNNIVKLTIQQTDQEVALSVDTPEVATGRESLAAQVAGGDIEIAFNVKYLLDGLKALNTSDITLRMNTPTSPAILVPIGPTKMTYLIMPVQVKT